MLAALEVLEIPKTDICPLEISDEDPLEIRPVVDAVGRKEFEPCSNMVPHADGEVLDDQVVIIHSSGSIDESKVFKPYTGGSSPRCIWRCWWVVESAMGTALSACNDQGPMVLGRLGWDFGRLVGNRA